MSLPEPCYEGDACRVFHGDCLDLLPSLPAECVDLVYLDPPFNTGKTWTVRHEDQERSFADKFPSMAAYVGFVRERAEQLHRTLKPTGSFYLHCDQPASSYLKMMLDGVFGIENFRNDIKWKRADFHNTTRKFGHIHDTIFYYGKTEDAELRAEHGDLWTDVRNINSRGRERVGYPTQKPEKLLERIVLASSKPGDLVLDPFCGSGTTLVAATKHNRRAVGMDISADACQVAAQRLRGGALQQPMLSLETA